MNTPSHSFMAALTEPRPTPARDVTWNRILFQPPALVNPRLVFDPLPFRHQPMPRPTRNRNATAGR